MHLAKQFVLPKRYSGTRIVGFIDPIFDMSCCSPNLTIVTFFDTYIEIFEILKYIEIFIHIFIIIACDVGSILPVMSGPFLPVMSGPFCL